MRDHAIYISLLVQKQLTNSLTAEEAQELEHWIKENASHRELYEMLNDDETVRGEVKKMFEYDKGLLRQKLADRYALFEEDGTPVRSVGKWRWIAAASIILLLGAAGWLFFNNSGKNAVTSKSVAAQHDIAPGTNRAVLTIDNKKIDLSSDKTGIAVGNTVTYLGGEKLSESGQLLQLTTPRGGQYQAVLPDGSKVWLNAASSIKFPSKFSDNERKVEVTGEAYFEIAKDATRPFKVSGGGQEVDVLGTSFNINIYDDEPIKKTTLITGSIKITHNNQTAILQPGQQANIPILSILPIRLIQVQTEDEIAWKNGAFHFNNADITTVLRQMERWYNIETVYPSGIPQKIISGKIGRNLSLSQAVEVLSHLGLRCTIEDRKLIMQP